MLTVISACVSPASAHHACNEPATPAHTNRPPALRRAALIVSSSFDAGYLSDATYAATSASCLSEIDSFGMPDSGSIAAGLRTMNATCPALMPVPASVGPGPPSFLAPAPWQLWQFASKTTLPAATSPFATVMLLSLESGIGSADFIAGAVVAADISVAAAVADDEDDELPELELPEHAATIAPDASTTVTTARNFFTAHYSFRCAGVSVYLFLSLPHWFSNKTKRDCTQNHVDCQQFEQQPVPGARVVRRRAYPVDEHAADCGRQHLRP